LYPFILILLLLAVLVETVLLIKGDGVRSVDIATTCRDPPIRREWRELKTAEKEGFLNAVLCLYGKRSIFPDRGSMYDDIVYVHQYSGQAGRAF